MKYIILIFSLIFVLACSSNKKNISFKDERFAKEYASIIEAKDSIAKESTFREIIPFLESKLHFFDSSAYYSSKIKWDLAEEYLLDHLVDGNDTALSKCSYLVNNVLELDVSNSFLKNELNITQLVADSLETSLNNADSRSAKELLFIDLFMKFPYERKIVGSWIQPIPGQAGKTQGIEFKTDGTASSINMQTLKYETWTWNKKGGKIILSGKSIGNGQTFSFADTFVVQKLNWDSLVLRKGEINMRYARLNVEDKHYK